MIADDAAAGLDLDALLAAGLDEALHLRVLLLGDQRPELDGGVEAVPDLDLAGLVDHALDDLVVDGLVREQARASGAALALVIEDRVRDAADRVIEIASGNTIAGDLPPSSRETRFRLPAAACTMSLPTSVDPVKATLSTSG